MKVVDDQGRGMKIYDEKGVLVCVPHAHAELTGVTANQHHNQIHAAEHVTSGGDVVANAIAAGNAGLMTGADKTKLDGITIANYILRSIVNDKGDLLHASAANILTALAIGTANHSLFVNAAGDLPEWALGIKIGTFTKDTADASGTQAISGVGFKPSHVIFFAGINPSVEGGVGFDNGSNHYCFNNKSALAGGFWGTENERSINFLQGGAIYYNGYISTLGSDGFTITWTKTGAKTGTATIFYMAFR